jgi:hypothetical protein
VPPGNIEGARGFLENLEPFVYNWVVSDEGADAFTPPKKKGDEPSSNLAVSEDSDDQSKGDKPDTVEDKGTDWRKLVNNAVWTVIGGLLGALVTGYFNLLTQKEKSSSELKIEETKVKAEIDLEKEKFNSSTKMERQKLDEDLIKLALQSPEIEKRKEALTFMAQTGLISDPDIKKGVEGYLAQGNPPPHLVAESLVRLDLERLAAGVGTLSDAIDAHRQLVKAKLDACHTPDERIVVLKDAVEWAKDLEDDQQSRFEAGTVSSALVLQAQQYHMQTESELATAQSAPKK